jgi:hypothetical protein
MGGVASGSQPHERGQEGSVEDHQCGHLKGLDHVGSDAVAIVSM